jgi:hypothetical protein
MIKRCAFAFTALCMLGTAGLGLAPNASASPGGIRYPYTSNAAPGSVRHNYLYLRTSYYLLGRR